MRIVRTCGTPRSALLVLYCSTRDTAVRCTVHGKKPAQPSSPPERRGATQARGTAEGKKGPEAGKRSRRGAELSLVQSYTPVSFCLWVILFTRLSSRRHILTSYLPATSVISSLVRTCVPSQAPLTRCTLYVWASKEYVVRGHGSSVAGPIYIP